ncbi:DUF2065 family protein [Rhodosalinus sediminis]|jgi:hypothetical protein|uniref:DUF2065 family protein n=1 Tax=Rhodosalinus sediminis TaxID=1940533 RepID=A0A3D9BMY0_9RHOB|nr:DUF2065 family protein [Rhodosalinus sediminis]REC54701.1 DUF2065 family protein [Rhodosalinus sediminis]
MEYLLLGLGLALMLEGLLYALAPGLVEQLLEALRALPQEQRRMLGLGAIALGLTLSWLAMQIGL